MTDRAVILAGGKGTRLHPYTVTIPKPLVPIGEFPVLEIIIRQLDYYGFRRITLAVNHQAELIRSFFGDGSKWGVTIDYSLEDKPLSTMGPLKLIHDLPHDFLVMNGDILTDLNFRNFFDYHVTANNVFTLSSYQREEIVDYGVLEVGNNNFLSGFKEKPLVSYHVSMGIYIMNLKTLDYIPPNTFYGFDHLMRDLIAANSPAAVRTYSGEWLDIGRPEDYAVATERFEKNRSMYLP